MITVTADTNIYVSGLVFGGLPLIFLNRARSGAFKLAVSQPLLSEVRRVLITKFGWSSEAVEAALSQLDRDTILVQPSEILDAVPADPDDNRILECAVAAASHYVVSGDKHLLRLGSYRGIPITRVATFMSLLPD